MVRDRFCVPARRAFTGKYNKTTEAGLYTCVVCDETLFTSETKFDSGCGWPAFNDVIDQKRVKLTTDTSNGTSSSSKRPRRNNCACPGCFRRARARVFTGRRTFGNAAFVPSARDAFCTSFTRPFADDVRPSSSCGTANG